MAAGDLTQLRPDVHEEGRPLTEVSGGAFERLIENDKRTSVARRCCEDVIGPLETEQFGAAPVGGALAAQRELGEPFEHMLRPRGHPERSAVKADELHQFAKHVEALVAGAGAHERACGPGPGL